MIDIESALLEGGAEYEDAEWTASCINSSTGRDCVPRFDGVSVDVGGVAGFKFSSIISLPTSRLVGLGCGFSGTNKKYD